MNIALCDDEAKILDETASFIKQEFPQCKVQAFSSGESFISSTQERPDVLLLDIDMPGMNGMEVASMLTQEKAQTLIVFVTAHDELVYDSFKYHPFAFVRKKYLTDELRNVLNDCKKEIAGRNRSFLFQTVSKTINLAQSDILYFESQANYLVVYTKDGEYRLRSTMANIEKELQSSDFLRIHKGFLVNLEHIKILKSDTLELDSGAKLPIGKSYSESAKESILRYMRR